ncbi:MAG: helix-turn-helix transcriptional regulator [Candidatus Nitrospinota bacterium M3_3B_026]
MDRFDRIYALHNILGASRYPVSRKNIQERLECSRATFTRLVEDMRDFLGAPIEYDRRLNGYHYAETDEGPYELPGLWFNASELHALLTCQELLSSVQPGLLDGHIAPLKKRIGQIMRSTGLDHGGVGGRIRILRIGGRAPDERIFKTAADATIQRRRLLIEYRGRERDETTEREISPQRLAYYRDNWYLDAWCHMRRALRSFSVDRIRKAGATSRKAKEISGKKLDSYFAGSYGIFAGKPKHRAVLRFSRNVAPWVSREVWFPGQEGRLDGGEYELKIPYADPRELILDILRYGPDVEVIAPASLRRAVRERLRAAARQHEV